MRKQSNEINEDDLFLGDKHHPCAGENPGFSARPSDTSDTNVKKER
jgi:hypothetical protein